MHREIQQFIIQMGNTNNNKFDYLIDDQTIRKVNLSSGGQLEKKHVIEPLAEILPLSNVIFLDLSHSCRAPKLSLLLFKTLYLSKITHLMLSGTSLYNQETRVLINELPRTQITHLDISNNNFTNDITNLIGKTLPKTKLKHLNIRSRFSHRGDGLPIFKSLRHSALESLCIDITHMRSDRDRGFVIFGCVYGSKLVNIEGLITDYCCTALSYMVDENKKRLEGSKVISNFILGLNSKDSSICRASKSCFFERNLMKSIFEFVYSNLSYKRTAKCIERLFGIQQNYNPRCTVNSVT